jgi:hypothetical protein
MLYFAYGSNLDWVQMRQRCPLAKFVCRAKLPAYQLAFTIKDAERRCGVADVLPDKSKDVWGVVYELPSKEVKDLDKDEDYRPGKPYDQSEYTREDHYVWREGDAKQPLLVALYRGHPQLDPPLPNDDYKDLIVNGAKHWNLPTEYIRQLESIRAEA